MFEEIDFVGCKTGTDFENRIVLFLNRCNIAANKTGNSDGGIDIVATATINSTKYSFNIQCKYYNATLSKAPIQEVYTGTHYYGTNAKPVVITNNRVTPEARVYAKRLGVEIIADAEWLEFKQVCKTRKIINPNPHNGLLGIMLSRISGDKTYLPEILKDAPKPPSDKEQLKLEITNTLDEAVEYAKEAGYLQQKAAQYQQRALTLQKEALLKNLGYD